MPLRKLTTLYLLAIASVLEASETKPTSLDSTLSIPEESITAVLRQTAMPDLGTGRLEKILARYYDDGLGGSENWDEIESLKVSGTLTIDKNELRLHLFRKKPQFVKMSIQGKGLKNVWAYDGEVAWKKVEGGDRKVEEMDPAEARRFIHSSHFGNHLLYPYAEGKVINYIDTVPVEGNICHQIRVKLDDEYQVDYFIDIRSYLAVKVLNTDLANGDIESITYKDYTRESGIPIARTVASHLNGKLISRMEVEEVIVNAGIMPWMFRMR